MRYITPDRFRSMGFGADLEGIEDVELASVIARSTAIVNSYCAAPALPQAHHFGGGVVVGEQHRWPLGTDTIRGTRRFYMYHRPVLSVQEFRIRLTNTMQVSVSDDDIFINNSEGYVELVSLAAVSFGVLPMGIVPNLGLYTPVAELDYTYGYLFTAQEELYATDALTYRATNGFWKTGSATITDNGATITGGFSIDYEDGSVLFTSPPTTPVTASYTYTMPTDVAMATGEIATDILAERSLNAKGMRRLAGIKMAEIEIRRSLRGTTVASDLTGSIPEAAAVLLEPYRFRSIQ